MTAFDIKIVSDTVCPWCYVGKKRLEQAISIYKQRHPNTDDTFTTTWFPFYLNPSAPKQSIDKPTYYTSKFGAARTEEIFGRLSGIGASVGIKFKFGGRTGNTRDSHRLIQLGKSKSPALQTRVVEELFAAYFENERDITDHKVLQEAAKKAGLEEGEVRQWLESDGGGEAVDREAEEARESAVSGVPNFTIQGQYELSGAQEPEAFVQLFERVKARGEHL